MIAGWTPEPGADVVITIRGKVKRLACHGRAALVQLDDGHDKWVEIPVGQLPSTALEWAPAEQAAS